MEDYDTNWWNITTLLASLGFWKLYWKYM
jgi:hypothetical protein